MDCENITVNFVEEKITANFNEDAVQVNIVDETIKAEIKEETVQAPIVEEILTVKLESSAVSYDGTKTKQLEDYIEAGEAINALKVLRNHTDNKAYIADSSDPAQTERIIGIAKTAAIAGNSVDYVISGIMEDASWNWDINSPIFFDSNGTLTQTPPATGFALVIAIPITNKKINVSIKQSIELA